MHQYKKPISQSNIAPSINMFISTLIIIFLLHTTTTSAQSPAQSPAVSSGPTNVTAILEKAGQFTTFIRLLKTTQTEKQLNTALNNSNQGLTIFAPSDNAFNSLKSGTLNSLNDQQKAQLIQFHVVPTYLTISQFQTVSNPLRTQAGGDTDFSLNVTTGGGNQVNVTSGLTNATVSNAMYTDGQLAVYQVDQVLLPIGIFSPRPPPAPAPETRKKTSNGSGGDSSSGSGDSSSGGLRVGPMVWVCGIVLIGTIVVGRI